MTDQEIKYLQLEKRINRHMDSEVENISEELNSDSFIRWR